MACRHDISKTAINGHFSHFVYRFTRLRGITLLFQVKVKGHLLSPVVKTHPSVVTRGQTAKFPKNSPDGYLGSPDWSKAQFLKNSHDDHLGSPEVTKQIFPRIPNIFIWSYQRSSKSKISQEFPFRQGITEPFGFLVLLQCLSYNG